MLAWQNPASAHRFPIFDKDYTNFETNNGLVWLDLGFTSNQAFETRWPGFLTAAEPFLGYRYAGAAGVLRLFTDADIKYLITHGSDPSINYLVELLRPRFFEKHENRTDNKIDDRDQDYSAYLNNWLLGDGSGGGAGSSPGGGSAPHDNFLTTSNSGENPPITPTPLPGSLPLLGFTLGCLGLFGRRKRVRTDFPLPN